MGRRRRRCKGEGEREVRPGEGEKKGTEDEGEELGRDSGEVREVAARRSRELREEERAEDESEEERD